MTELEELRIAYAECSRQRNELLAKLKQQTTAQPWVGLNASDLAEIPPSCYEGAIWADARLKEKNT